MGKRFKIKIKNYRRFCLGFVVLVVILWLTRDCLSMMYSSNKEDIEDKIIVDTPAQELVTTQISNQVIEPILTPIDDLSVLEQEIDAKISSYNGEWQIYIKNLETNQYISLNSRPIKAASIIKLFNMMAFYNYVDENNLTITQNQRDLLSAMITVSSNEASNSLVELIGKGNFLTGGRYVTNYCENQGYIDTSEAQRLYDVVPEGAVMTGNNRVSADDCGKALEQIYRGECINEEYSKKMLDLLLKQYYNDKIPMNLPSSVEVAHKTGQTSDVDSDVGIVFSENCDYIICILTKDATNSTTRIADLSQIVYEYFNDTNICD